VKLPEGRSLPSESRHPARGEAFRRKRHPARGEASRRKRRTPFLREEAKDALPSGGSRRTCFFQNKFASFGFLRLPSASFGFLRKAATPPEVKLPEGSRRSRFFQNKFRKPKDALFSKQVRFLRKAARGEASRRTFRKPKDALFSKQVHQAEGRPSQRKGRSFTSGGRTPFLKEAQENAHPSGSYTSGGFLAAALS